MINAIVQNKQGKTAVIDLTVYYHEIYKELQSLGYYGSPERLLLRDEEDEEYSVKLYSDSDNSDVDSFRKLTAEELAEEQEQENEIDEDNGPVMGM